MKARLDVSAGRASLDAVATRGYFKGAPAVRTTPSEAQDRQWSCLMSHEFHDTNTASAQVREALRPDASDSWLLLKWGSIKGWGGLGVASMEFLQRWIALGVSMSAMAQHDTPEQKDILCDLIRQFQGQISNDWDGETYSKERAVDYIMNYGKRRS